MRRLVVAPEVGDDIREILRTSRRDLGKPRSDAIAGSFSKHAAICARGFLSPLLFVFGCPVLSRLDRPGARNTGALLHVVHAHFTAALDRALMRHALSDWDSG